MIESRKLTGLGILCCALMLLTSVAASQEPDEKRFPKVELSAGTWLSVGDTRWAHNASSQPGLGNPTSQLIYKDVGTNVIDLTGKVWLPSKIFVKINFGFADIGGGRLTDNDYGTGQQLFSSTQSDINGNNMWYLNADLGGRVKEFPNSRGYLDVFGGVQYWRTEYQAVGIFQAVCNPNVIPGLTCQPTGTSTHQGQTVITNTTNWYSFRTGLSSEYRITRRLSVNGYVAFIPASLLNNSDQHHLRGDLQQNPSFSMTGYAVGVDADAGIRFIILKNLAANVGYRVYYNRVLSGDMTVHPVTGPTSSFPLTQFESLRHGLTAGLTLMF